MKIPARIVVLVSIMTLVVAIVLVAGFMTIGSPCEARKLAADRERVSDLEALATQIQTSYIRNKTLPSGLSDLTLSQSESNSLATDPFTGKSYEYHILSKTEFELCAEFETDATKVSDRGGDYGYSPYDSPFRHHTSGHFCAKFPAKGSGY